MCGHRPSRGCHVTVSSPITGWGGRKGASSRCGLTHCPATVAGVLGPATEMDPRPKAEKPPQYQQCPEDCSEEELFVRTHRTVDTYDRLPSDIQIRPNSQREVVPSHLVTTQREKDTMRRATTPAPAPASSALTIHQPLHFPRPRRQPCPFPMLQRQPASNPTPNCIRPTSCSNSPIINCHSARPHTNHR